MVLFGRFSSLAAYQIYRIYYAFVYYNPWCFCVGLQAGIIEEMMDDAFESMEDQDELEEEAETEVEKVLWELTAGVTVLITLCFLHLV